MEQCFQSILSKYNWPTNVWLITGKQYNSQILITSCNLLTVILPTSAGTIVHAKVGFIVTHSVVYILNGSFRYITANWILKAGTKAHFQIGGWLTTESEFYKFYNSLPL